MKKLFTILAFAFLLAQSAYAQSPSIKSYQKGDWKALTRQFAGQPLAIHFWGVTCAACIKELPQWGKFLAQNKNAKIIFIQVDETTLQNIQKSISKANLLQATNYYVDSPFDERLRYEIDPTWYGETPTTILIDPKGKVVRKTGLIDFSYLGQFLRNS
jgi:hypothetical protein